MSFSAENDINGPNLRRVKSRRFKFTSLFVNNDAILLGAKSENDVNKSVEQNHLKNRSF